RSIFTSAAVTSAARCGTGFSRSRARSRTDASGSRCVDFLQQGADFLLEAERLVLQRGYDVGRRLACRAGAYDAVVDAADAARHRLDALRRDRDAAGDLVGGGVLLTDRLGNGGNCSVDVGYRRPEGLDHADGVARRV